MAGNGIMGRLAVRRLGSDVPVSGFRNGDPRSCSRSRSNSR